MKPLKLEQIKVGDQVVFIDRRLNVGDCHVPTARASVPLDGRLGVVVHIAERTECTTTCASKSGEEEHPPCDCGATPGKDIAVCLKQPHASAHTCDGLVDVETEIEPAFEGEPHTEACAYEADNADECDCGAKPARAAVKWFHGVYARPSHLYTVEAYNAHKAESDVARAKHEQREGQKKSAAAIAKRFLGR